MEFLNKLYESNYFGIVLFAVIAFLVVTFLIVLFFGKKDEKKRKLEETNNIENVGNVEDTFKEVETPTTELEIKATPIVEPVNVEPINIVEETNDVPVIEEQPVEVAPVIEPITFDNTYVEPVSPISYENNEEKEVKESVVDPITIEPIIFEAPVDPIVMDPVKFEPEAPVVPVIEEAPASPVIEESVTPIIMDTEKFEPHYEEITPIIEETTIGETYYNPVENVEEKEVEVPNFDFDAIARSISKELDALEENGRVNENVEVTPINEVTSPETFSSVYVNKEVSRPHNNDIELPKRIEMPARKEETNR